MYPGAVWAGELHLAQIGITRRALRAEPEMFTFLKETAGDLLPARNPGGNKGTFGKVVLVAGRHNMCGAALLAVRACLAAGAGMVHGIEIVKEAVISANRNAVVNHIVNALYYTGKAEEVLPTLGIGHADVAILDPPRKGCEESLLRTVAEAAPDRIVYVSCDPATLGRDVAILEELGYRFVEATPVDMFCHTSHVESVCLLSKNYSNER